MTTPIRYTDWQITQKHAEILRTNSPIETRHMNVRKSIPGVVGKRITRDIKTGLWFKPLGLGAGKQFSCVHDTIRTSLVVLVQGTTTGQAKTTPDYDEFRKWVYALFHQRRATGLNGEVYTMVSAGDYDMDDGLAGEFDVDVYEIASRFREDRYDGWVH